MLTVVPEHGLAADIGAFEFAGDATSAPIATNRSY